MASRPEYLYFLGFSPQNLKLDGSFHKLKVSLKEPNKLALQARHGYYAPRHMADADETAKQEIEDALFSREELHDLPVELHTQFFKASDLDAKLTVLARVEPPTHLRSSSRLPPGSDGHARAWRFRQAQGRVRRY